MLDQIIEHGQVLRGWLGVLLHDTPRGEAGLFIVRVYPRTPAAEAGLQPGDLLLTINDEPVGTAREATLQLRDTDPGSELRIRFKRNGAVRQVKVTTALFPLSGS